MNVLRVPAIRIHQRRDKPIYSFCVNGKDITRFARVSRIRRDDDGDLAGYQRSEVLDHIGDIRDYLQQPEAVLPNSIVVSLDRDLKFTEREAVALDAAIGVLEIPINDGDKCAWIVDGQQRVAAMRSMKREVLPVSVIAFRADSVDDEREQFVLVNNTRPLPKSLVYELLPAIGNGVPPKLKKRQKAYRLLEQLHKEEGSPFRSRIKTVTSRHLKTANISDTAVLRMIENSTQNGALYHFNGEGVKALQLLRNFWAAVAAQFPEAWQLSPKQSRLTHGTGIVSMGFLMDTIYYRLSNRWQIVPPRSFQKELDCLGDLPWCDGIWKFSTDMTIPWNEIQNTSRHIELVTDYLIRKYRRRAEVVAKATAKSGVG